MLALFSVLWYAYDAILLKEVVIMEQFAVVIKFIIDMIDLIRSFFKKSDGNGNWSVPRRFFYIECTPDWWNLRKTKQRSVTVMESFYEKLNGWVTDILNLITSVFALFGKAPDFIGSLFKKKAEDTTDAEG